MNTLDGLLRAVLENPADDIPRLVYADALQDADEADRAEFVRVQCRIATLNAELMSDEDCDATNCPGCGERRELQRRERELWLMAVAEELPARWVLPPPDGFTFRKLPGDEWETDGRPHISQAEYRRGFVAEIRLPLALFLAHARDLFAAHPITAVVISDVRPGRYGDRYRLYPKDADAAAAVDNCPYPIWRRIEGVVWLSEAAADSALSAACTAYGRRAAGLPPLE